MASTQPPQYPASAGTRRRLSLELTRVTPDDGHCFFGYYDKHQFDAADDRYVLGQKVRFMDRPPRADDVAEIGMVNVRQPREWIPLGQTTAWCWQQGCMLQWVPGREHEVIYNVRGARGYESLVVNAQDQTTRRLPRAIYCVSHDGRTAICNDFARLGHTRPGYGYIGIDDPNFVVFAPADSGFWRMDIRSGESQLIVSIARLYDLDPSESTRRTKHWVNHALFNPDSSRFGFVHRWRTPDGGFATRLCTCDPDGSDLCYLSDSAREGSWHASHFWWHDNHTLLVWGAFGDTGDGAYMLVEDQTGKTRQLNRELLPCNGHVSYCPRGEGMDRWILSDTYPEPRTNLRTLFLYHPLRDERIDIAEVDAGICTFANAALAQCRCDLHPRWNRAGTQVCIDSVHEGYRAMYVVDVSPITLAG